MDKPKHISKGSFILCIFIGVIVMNIAIFVQVKRIEARTDCTRVEASVDSNTDGVTVSYTINGTSYNKIAIHTLNTPAIGTVVTVYVDNTDNSSAYSDDTSRLLFTLFLVLSILFIASGTAALIVRAHMLKGVDSLVEAGHYIYAAVDKTIYETSIADSEGRHPYIIECHYSDFNGNHRHDYRIDDLYKNPAEYLAGNKNCVKIYIKGKNYSKYSIDPKLYV